MGLNLKFKAEISNCEALKITDTTGAYSAGNTGGWGTPNINPSDVLSATIEVVTGQSSETFDVLSLIPDPVIGEFIYPDITLASFDDGIYDITYTITTATETFTYLLSLVNLCNIRCCLDKKWAEFAKSCNSCNEFPDYLMFAEALYETIKRGIPTCGGRNDVESYLEKLKKLCNTNCKTC